VLDAGIIGNVVSRPALLLILAVTAVLAWPVGRLLRRGALGVWFVVVLGAVFAATGTTGSPYYSTGGVRTYLAGFDGALLDGFAGNYERLANIGLFLPLGALATLLWRRPVLAVLGCAVLSFVIEGWQGFIGRGGDPVDVVHNTVGGLLGAGLADVVVWRRAG
jgi:hypothetical protein